LGSIKDDQIDILEYWKRNATAYPILAMMARDIFAVYVSTVPSESCFSDAESRMQHDTTFEAATSAIETQESGTNISDISLEDDSDDPYDIQDNDL
jgi:hAT family C-terminal dimerisation region